MKESTVNRKINFGSGPAALPEDVLRQASEAVVDYTSSGLSILEIPHRGELFTDIIEESKQLVKELCGLSDDYEVLWLHGGGRLQFCMVPMNFLGAQDTAGYVDSGHWSAEAITYAQYYGGVQVLASTRNNNYNSLPILPADVSADLTYLHLTTNNTIYGTQWPELPKSSVPLIADMSSDIFSRKRDYSACAMFYAVAQKNIGAAGTTLVVIHKDQLATVKRELPPMLDYRAHVEKKSVLNTSPVFAIYTALLMLRWTKARTIETLEQESIRKSAILYEALEKSKVFSPVVTRVEDRSRMNVCFKANNAEIEKGFSDFCTRNGIAGLEGHRTVGGFRVSLYNAITVTQVEQLVCVMQEYEAIQHSKLNNSKSS